MGIDLRDRSWRDRCSERENARLQNWHLYRFSFSFTSPPAEALRLVVGEAVGGTGPATADMAQSCG